MSASFLAQSIAAFDMHMNYQSDAWGSEGTEFKIQRMRAIPSSDGEAFLVWMWVRYSWKKVDRKKKTPDLEGFLVILVEGGNMTVEKFVCTYHVASFLFKQPTVERLKQIVEQLPEEKAKSDFYGDQDKSAKLLITEIQQFETVP